MKCRYTVFYKPMLSQLLNRLGGNDDRRQLTSSSQQTRATGSRFRFSKPIPHYLKGESWCVQPLQMKNAAITYEAYLTNPGIPIHPNNPQRSDEAYTWKDHEQWIQRAEQEHRLHKCFSFAVLDETANKCLGCLHLGLLRPFLSHNHAPDRLLIRAGENTAMVAYWLRQSFFNEDIACQLIRTIHQWLNEDWGLPDHYFRVNPSNTGSIHTLEAAGLQVRFDLALTMAPYQYTFYGA